MDTMKSYADYYQLQKIVSDLKADLKQLKNAGVDPGIFLGGRCKDLLSQYKDIASTERRRCRSH